MEYKYFPCTITADNKKIPLINDWQALATCDPAQMQQWSEMFRERLTHWGMPMGKTTGIIALDVDVKDASKNGFKTIEDNNLIIPPTTTQNTITGGRHYLYQYPDDGKQCGNRVGVHPGLDIRGDAGYIIVYELDQTPLAPAPDWLVQASRQTFEPPPGDPIAVSPAIALATLGKCLQEIFEAPEGERNHTLNKQGFIVGQLVASGALEEQYAKTALEKVAIEIGLDAHEIKHTLNSCIKGGHQKPLTSPFSEPKPLMDMIVTPVVPMQEDWNPPYMTMAELADESQLKRPQLFKTWSTQDIQMTIADGGTGKTTLKLYEAICLALGASFLGFECVKPGKTLYITGEDTAGKLKSLIGKMCKQMQIWNDPAKMDLILANIKIKKDSDTCIVAKDKNGFLISDKIATAKIIKAANDFGAAMIIFDPISTYWGSEAGVNDMGKAVLKGMSEIVTKTGAAVDMIAHMGKQSSSEKDMSQFAVRGCGTALPSGSRVIRVMRGVNEDEYKTVTGEDLKEKETAIMCNVAKFTDGSPLLSKQFLIIREGYLFSHKAVDEKVMAKSKATSDQQRVFDFIQSVREDKKYATKTLMIGYFKNQEPKLSKQRVIDAIEMLTHYGHGVMKISLEPGTDALVGSQVFVIRDKEGKEI